MSIYTGVTNFQKQSGFLAHPVCIMKATEWALTSHIKYIHTGNVVLMPTVSTTSLVTRHTDVACPRTWHITVTYTGCARCALLSA